MLIVPNAVIWYVATTALALLTWDVPNAYWVLRDREPVPLVDSNLSFIYL